MRYFIWLCAFLCLPFRLLATGNGPVFDYLGIEHGLSNNAVNCIYQDSYGFMWFGTYDGLNRYDGYSFKVFRNRINDSTSLVNNWVVALQEDRQHNIWVGTKQGLNLYHPLSGRFSSVYFSSAANSSTEKIQVAVNGLSADSKGNVLVATAGKGLLVFNTGEANGMQIPLHAAGKTRYNYHVQSVKLDVKKRVWLFIQGFGLALYNDNNHSIKLVDGRVTVAKCLQPDLAGNIWMGTEAGVFEYCTKLKTLAQHTAYDGFLPIDNVHGLSVDHKGVLWIATDGGGIITFDPVTKKREHIEAGHEKGALTSSAVYAVFEDKDKRKWIGTLRGGINILDDGKNRFQTISQNTSAGKGLISNFILSFCEDELGNVVIGTDGEGISYWNRKQNSFTNYQRRYGDRSSLSSNNVASIVMDHTKAIWVATYGGGICKFNRAAGTFERYVCLNPQTGNYDRNAWGLYEDSRQQLWLGTCTAGGLYRFNRAANEFQLFDQQLTDVITIGEDKKGTLWVGTFDKLIKVDQQRKAHTYYSIGRSVRAIKEDRRGNFWIGTEGGGLLLFNRQTGKFETFSEDDGLPGNAVLNILEDDAGNLWISTFNGLCRFNPTTRRFKNFYESDGLQSNQFNYNAALKLHSGEFLFGGIKGFSVFRPDEIKPFGNAPRLLITGLRTNNTPYEADDSFDKKTIVHGIKNIELPYDKAVLSVDFAALEYTSPNKILYSYYLEGLDNGWGHATRVRTVNYSRLREGNYKLHIRSTNAEGVWLKNEQVLNIKVLPPWWRSWWAYTLYLAIGGYILYQYLKYQRKQTYMNYQVQLANLKVEQEQELNERKLSFFTHISHEFRTPLTLIINPIKEALNSGNGQVDSKELIIVYRNASRLLSLVDQLLLFRKSNAETLKVSQFNLVTFCKEVYLCFSQQARSRNMQFGFECDKEELLIYADKEKMEVALFNLLSNAFKFTPDGGTINLNITELDDEVLLKVTDTGPGIADDVGNKLFEKFYQVFDRGQAKAGFGIGLYLVKKFVDSHSGQISYTSAADKGTEFSISLPKGNKHFSADVIYEDNGETSMFIDELLADTSFTEAQPVPEATAENSLEMVTEQPVMLIVDDNDDVRNYVKQLFAPNYTLYEADCGETGLQLARKHVPDIIITDVVMKEMSGVELCTKIKEDPNLSHIPVILLTSSSSAEIKLKGIEGGADDYITKPFDKDILIARVSNLLKSRSNLQRFFYNEITLKADDTKVSGEYKEFLDRCIKITEKHLTNNNFNVQILADEIGLSHSALYKRVKSISGKTINEFIRYIRLRKAAQLFATTDCNVNEAAFQSGFNDIKYFREQFAKLFGMKPSEYIKKYRQAFNKPYKLNEKLRKTNV